MIDFIKDARELGISDIEIVSLITTPQGEDLTKEEHLINTLERKIIENQNEKSIRQEDQDRFKERFNLVDILSHD